VEHIWQAGQSTVVYLGSNGRRHAAWLSGSLGSWLAVQQYQMWCVAGVGSGANKERPGKGAAQSICCVASDHSP